MAMWPLFRPSLPSPAPAPPTPAPPISFGPDVRQQKQQRLIVRNLNFHATEQDLATAFSELGPLAEVCMIRESTKKAGVSMGAPKAASNIKVGR